MSLLEDRIARILELRQSGRAIEEISQDMNLTKNVIKSYEDILKRNLKEFGGKPTLSFAGSLGISPLLVEMAYGVYGMGIHNDIPTPKRDPIRRYRPREETAKHIRELFDKGINTHEAMSRETGLAETTIFIYSRELGIKLKGEVKKSLNLRHHPRKRKPDVDKLILEGKTLEGIGEEAGLTREAVRQYIKRTGQYRLYREKRKEIISNKDTKSGRRRLLREVGGLISLVAMEKSSHESWPVQKTIEYLLKHRTSYQPEKLVKFFSTYKKAQDNGDRLSLKRLARIIESEYASEARFVLKESGLEPMYGTRKKASKTPKNKQKAMLRAANSKLSRVDISYFLGLKPHTTNYVYAKEGIRRDRRNGIKKLGSPKGRLLTYRLASEIYKAISLGFRIDNYKAVSLGFRIDKIPELLDTSREVVDYALKNRSEIENDIIRQLRVLYNNPKVRKPYKDLSMLR